jgi:hypothetical protein
MCVRVGAWVYVVCVCVCVHSCHSQALTWVHVHVCMGVCRQVLLYIFYGTYQTDWGNPAPIVGAIHYDIQNGSYRFCGTVEIAFKQLLEILRADPKQGELLTDLGEGTASEAYLVAVEAGLRNTAKMRVNIFPKNCMASYADWSNVAIWRKRQCYLYFVRHFRKRPSYKKWDHFRWEDFIEREQVR